MSNLELRDYQRRGIKFWLQKKSVYYAVDMGLGKTAMALRVLQRVGLPALVIVPKKPMFLTWPDEIKKWAPELTYTILHGGDKEANLDLDVDIYLCNPEGIKWLYNALAKRFKCGSKPRQEMLIIDEGSMWKAPKTQRFKFLKAMLPLFPVWRAILSGTPSPNSYEDLWSQYYILDEGKSLTPNFHRFRNKYFQRIPRGVYDEYIMKEGSFKEIYDAISPRTFRLDEKDHLTLPPRLKSNMELELTPKLRKLYVEFKKEFIIEIEGLEVDAISQASLSMKLRQFLQGAVYTDDKGNYQHIHNIKLDALGEILETLNGNPLLCAVQFKFEKEMILKKFPGTPFISGGTNDDDAIRYVREWNEGKIPFLCTHPASIGHGTNLQFGGHNALWYALPWNLEHYLQFNKRLHRSGQKKPVNIMHLVFKNSIDELVVKALDRKDMNQRRLLDYLREVTLEQMA